MGLFDEDEWGQTVERTTDFARPETLRAHLLIVLPIGYIPHSPTRFSQPGKKSDAIVIDVIDLDDVDETGQPGKVYRAGWWRQSQLIISLRPFIGKKVLGVIGKGTATNGMNPPWIIQDMTTDTECMNRARAWAQAHPNFAVSPFQQPDPVAAPPAPQQPAFSNGNGYNPPQQPQWQQQPPQGGQGYSQPPGQQQFYQQQAPQPQFQQQSAPQYQQPGQQPYVQQPQQGYGQPQYQQPQNGAPRFPVQGAGVDPTQDQNMLDRMRAMRGDLEASRQYGQQTGDAPPF